MTGNINPIPRDQASLEEHSTGWLADNAIVAASFYEGTEPMPEEMIELIAEAKLLYILATLQCRGLAKVHECHQLWVEARNCFKEAANAWESVQMDCPLIAAYRHQLSRLLESSIDRVTMYEVNSQDRYAYLVGSDRSAAKKDLLALKNGQAEV